MNRKRSLIFLLNVLVLASAPSIFAAQSYYQAVFDGPSESPPNASPGFGTGFYVYDDVAHTFGYNVAFSGLTGTTTLAHIHAATTTAFSGTAGVATTQPAFPGFPLGVTSGAYINTMDLTQSGSWNAAYITANGGTTAGAEAAFIGAINAGKAYFNIHTSTFGGGEIRGFLVQVPEPASCTLVGLALVGLAGIARRRR